MSINSLQGFAAVSEAQLASTDPRPTRTRPGPSRGNEVQRLHTDPGSVPKRELRAAQTSPPQPFPEQYEVQVQPDTELQSELIFKYVDKTGHLVLQVPSAQALNVKRGILEEFQQRADQALVPARRL